MHKAEENIYQETHFGQWGDMQKLNKVHKYHQEMHK